MKGSIEKKPRQNTKGTKGRKNEQKKNESLKRKAEKGENDPEISTQSASRD